MIRLRPALVALLGIVAIACTKATVTVERGQVRCVMDPAAMIVRKAGGIVPLGRRADGTPVAVLVTENDSGRLWLGESPTGGYSEGSETAAETACREFGEEVVLPACGMATIQVGGTAIIDTPGFALFPATVDTASIECLARQTPQRLGDLPCHIVKVDDSDAANTVCVHLWTPDNWDVLNRASFRFPTQQAAILQTIRAHFGK